MTASIINHIRYYLGFSWLTGPVFDKELRVSSRKRRNYVLRFLYISLLLTILFFVWIQVIDYRGANVVQVSRMAQAGKYIVTFIVWFQFCAAQVIAVIMLSNSISDEIYHKTLGMLMTTPITSLQIVMGKLFSKLLQLILLLAISMPLLAVVRLFGGVPWKFVTSSLCITLSMVIFVSSLSLFYSIFSRRAYVVIIKTVLTLLALFALLPFLIATVVYIGRFYSRLSEQLILFIIYQPNPYMTLFLSTLSAVEPRAGVGMVYNSVYINCAFLLVLSLILLILSMIMVRRVALRQAIGQLNLSRERKSIIKSLKNSQQESKSSIIRVFGSPILWKELILPIRKRVKKLRILAVLIFLGLIGYSYWFFYRVHGINEEVVHVFYTLIFMGLGTLFTLVLSATTITSEKESSSWPLLLTSTLDDRQIIFGKFIGVLSRCMPVWILLPGHVFFFYFMGIIHPAAIPLTVILVTWYVILLCSSGLYFSSLFKRTTTAVIMNFVFALFIWGINPLIFGILCEIVKDYESFKVYVSINPFIQVIVIMISTVGRNINQGFGGLDFDWPAGYFKFNTTLCIFVFSFCGYMTLAMLFLWRAKKRLRRKIF